MCFKNFILIICLLLIVLFMSCLTLAESAQKLPLNVFIHSKSDLSNEKVIYDNKNKFNEESATKILNNNLFPLIYTTITKTTVSNGKSSIIQNIEYERDMKELDRIINLIFIDYYTKVERNYFLGSSNLVYNAGFTLGASVSFDRVFEYEISSKNPQVRVEYIVNPLDLLREQLATEEENRKTIILFAYEIFAPEMFYEHMISSIKANASIPILFNSEGGLSSTERINLSNTFIIRRYQEPEKAKLLLTDNNVKMFNMLSTPCEEIFGDKLQPSSSLVFKYQNKYYSLSREYAQHLNAEHVYFKYNNKDETEKVKQIISQLSDEELVKLISILRDRALVNINPAMLENTKANNLEIRKLLNSNIIKIISEISSDQLPSLLK